MPTKIPARRSLFLALSVFAATVLSVTASFAAHQQTVGDLTIHIGITPAAHALTMPGEATAHPSLTTGSTHHLVVTAIDHRSAKRVEDAVINVEVRGATTGVQTKPLIWHTAASSADFSEAFRFDRKGKYTIRVSVLRKGDTKPVLATFSWQHDD